MNVIYILYGGEYIQVGMIGNYVAINEDELNQIRDGKIDLADIDSSNYDELDIDKSWQAIHFLLCEDIEDGELPLGYVVPILLDNGIKSDYEYGAYYLTNEQVKVAHESMKSLSKTDLLGMYHFESFVEKEIYPIVKNEDEEQFFEYIYRYFLNISKFFEKIITDKNAVVFYIS